MDALASAVAAMIVAVIYVGGVMIYRGVKKDQNNQSGVAEKPIPIISKEQMFSKPEFFVSEIEEDHQMDQKVEDGFYEKAWTEIQNDQTKKGIWARAFSESAGDKEKTNAKYINYRVIDLKNQAVQEQEVRKKQTVEKCYHLGIFFDEQTKLMWTVKDNGSDIDWLKAEQYCKNLQLGEYKNWRMPTQQELENLHHTILQSESVLLTAANVWSSETESGIRGKDLAWYFSFKYGNSGKAPCVLRRLFPEKLNSGFRALPVRSVGED